MDFRSGLAGVLALIALSGCTVNPYSRSYVANNYGYDIRTNRVAPAPEQPDISRIVYSELESTNESLRRRGFQSLGYSSFKTEDDAADSMAVEQAKSIGADLVVIIDHELARSYTRTREVSEPVGNSESVTTVRDEKGRATGETATTRTVLYETRYVSSTVDIYDYGAFYWIRTNTGLGVQLTRLSPTLAKTPETANGARIDMVIYDSPADRADLRENDIIESVDGKTVTSPYVFEDYPYVPGQALKLVITRDNKKLEKTLIAGERPNIPMK
ncbi:PDZ domain-containing protein [Pseudomonas cremoricolorata]|uniref:PDZ domain-containing protein n=1 Tax=Pseudomonas cremoricolorata TaxID=157783 RepID=A0A089WIV3_9PSED|nr:PDZ domain-containing protein [Pseudomonas cremoricolorata]AIR88531.1 hypothetical protein LK03_04360 [Pseudomonas cremoricolorata]